jgi:hypothetical protein
MNELFGAFSVVFPVPLSLKELAGCGFTFHMSLPLNAAGNGKGRSAAFVFTGVKTRSR